MSAYLPVERGKEAHFRGCESVKSVVEASLVLVFRQSLTVVAIVVATVAGRALSAGAQMPGQTVSCAPRQ